MGIRLANPIDYPDWDEQIARHPGCTFFHSAAWARVLADSYGYLPLYCVAFDNERISACLPVMEVNSALTGRRGVSLPFTDCCDVLATGVGQFQELFGQAVNCGKDRGWKSLELRGGDPFLNGAPASSSYFIHTLDLQPGKPSCIDSSPSLPFPVCNPALLPAPFGSDGLSPSSPGHSAVGPFPSSASTLFSSFRDSTKRNIKKASASGVSVRIETSEESVRQFYRLNQLTRRDHGLPPQPYRFFEEVYDHIISKGKGAVALAIYESKPVAASVYFHFGRTAVYKYGASDKTYQRLRANNLVMWQAIDNYASNGYDTLSFGRTDLDHAGLRQFKMGWGVSEQRLDYYRYSMRSGAFVSTPADKATGVGNRAVSKMPLPVLRAVGSLLYRHMG